MTEKKLVDVSKGGKFPVLERDTEYVLWHGEKKKIKGFADGREEPENNEIAVICQDKKKTFFTIFLE